MSKKKLIQIARKFPKLCRAMVSIRDVEQGNRPMRMAKHGFSLAGSESMINGKFEVVETQLIQRLLENFEVFVNIGANVGYYCCIAAKAGLQVVAFEPHPVNCRLLLRNLKQNSFDKLSEVHPTALGAETGILELFGSGTAASLVEGWAGISSESSRLVPILRLDDVLRGRFQESKNLILIDVEGAELHVLRGALETLGRDNPPWWVIEVNINEHQPSGITINPNLVETFKLIYGAGYKVWTFDAAPRAIELGQFMTIAETGKNHLKTHNFLCMPAAEEANIEEILIG